MAFRWRLGQLELAASKDWLSSLGRDVKAGPLVEDFLRQGERGWFAREDIKKGSCIGFVHAADAFSAQNIYQKSNSPLTSFVKDALEGYKPLKDSQPRIFNELELATLLWAERRGSFLDRPSTWDDWLRELPDCCWGTRPFLNQTLATKMMSSKIKDDIGSEAFNGMVKSIDLQNQVFEVFSSSIEQDLASVLELLEDDENLTWGRGDPERLKLPFSELLREELSLVLSRGLILDEKSMVAATKGGSDLRHRVGDLAIFPGLDFLNFSPTNPNALLLTPGNDIGAWSSWIENCFEERKDMESSSNRTTGIALAATRNISSGEEILLPLDFCNIQTCLQRYGFSPLSQPAEIRTATSPASFQGPELVIS